MTNLLDETEGISVIYDVISDCAVLMLLHLEYWLEEIVDVICLLLAGNLPNSYFVVQV